MIGGDQLAEQVTISRSPLRGQRLLALGVLSTLRGVFMDYLGIPWDLWRGACRQGIEQNNVQDMESSTRVRKCNP